MRISRREITSAGVMAFPFRDAGRGVAGGQVAEHVFQAGRLAQELEQRPAVVDGRAEDRLAQIGRGRRVEREGVRALLAGQHLAAGHARQARQAVADRLLGHAVRFDDHPVAAAFFARAQRVGRAVGDQLAAADDQDAAAGRLDLRQDVGREDDRLLAADLLDERPDLDDLVGVEAAGRLVEDQDVGIVQHRLRQADALPEPLGQLARPPCRRRRRGRSGCRPP